MVGNVLIRRDAHLITTGMHVWIEDDQRSYRVVCVWRTPGNVQIELENGLKLHRAPLDPVDCEEHH